MFGLLVLSLACSRSAEGTAADVGFDATRSGTSARTVQGALDELYVRCNADKGADAAPADTQALAALGSRVQELEFKVSKLEQQGLYDATQVTYDPRSGTLTGKTVQAAVEELEARVGRFEESKIDQGKPGAALFELRDKNGRPVGGPNGGPQGPPNGGQGPPNGQGGPNGGRPQGGMGGEVPGHPGGGK